MAAGGHGLVVGVKAFAGNATNASWSGLYFAGGMRYDTAPTRLTAAVGAVNATSLGSVWARRTRQSDGLFDASPLITYSLGADGSGTYTSTQGHVDLASTSSDLLHQRRRRRQLIQLRNLFRRARPPSVRHGRLSKPARHLQRGELRPRGIPSLTGRIRHAIRNRISLPVHQREASLPKHAWRSTTHVNGTPAPIYAVSSSQISAIVPIGVTGSTATFVLTVNSVQIQFRPGSAFAHRARDSSASPATGLEMERSCVPIIQ